MKHWSVLMELESAIIRVGEFKNLFKLLVAGTENSVDIKVLQSAIYTMEGMIDDIDSTLYKKFETVFDAVRDESFPQHEEFEEEQEEFEEEQEEFNFPTMNEYNVNAYSTVTVPQTETQWDNTIHSTVQINSNSYEDEAFKDLEKALKNWKHTAP